MVDLFHLARRRTIMADANPPTATPTETRCARCRAALRESDRVTAEDRVFCRTCYDILKLELRRGVATMSEDINYPRAVLGAVLGGVVGVLAWWASPCSPRSASASWRWSSGSSSARARLASPAASGAVDF